MQQRISVLTIEDNPDDFLLLQAVLENNGELIAHIHHASRLAEGLILAEKEPVDVAILDLSLPDSVGLATFNTFHDTYPSIPTILLTGCKDHEVALEAVKSGAQDYLFKGEPSATAIIRTLRYAIERQRLMTELQQAQKHVRQLQGYLPICASCKKIRDDNGYWNAIEAYFQQHSEVCFTHGICPDCVSALYPNLKVTDEDAS